MPIQSPAWNDFLKCPMCYSPYEDKTRLPLSLACGHTLCVLCLHKLHARICPYDQAVMKRSFSDLSINWAILSIIPNKKENGPFSCIEVPNSVPPAHSQQFMKATEFVCRLALFLKPYGGSMTGVTSGLSNMHISGGTGSGSGLSRSMQRKLVTLINCQLVEFEGRVRAIKVARSLGERTVTELILHLQNHHQLSANLWAAVRARGCQFLGPAMQEEVIKLVLLALEDGSALSRKVLVMYVVQRLKSQFPQASKTSIGHVVQLLYRASCFKVSKREKESSLMQLKEEFRSYDSLRREHDTQIVQIASEAGLRIAPDQWSSLLYGDVTHKSHMQSIMDKLQTPQSFVQGVTDLLFSVERNGDPGYLTEIFPQLEYLSKLDPEGCCISDSEAKANANLDDSSEAFKNEDCSAETEILSWEISSRSMESIYIVLAGLVRFLQTFSGRKMHQDQYHHQGQPAPRFGKNRVVPRGNYEHSNQLLNQSSDRVDEACSFNSSLSNEHVRNKSDHIDDESYTDAISNSNYSCKSDEISARDNISEGKYQNHRMSNTPTKVYEVTKTVGNTAETHQPPFLSVPPTPPNVVRLPSAPSQSAFIQPTNQSGGMYNISGNEMLPPHYQSFNPQSSQVLFVANAPYMSTGMKAPIYPNHMDMFPSNQIVPPNAPGMFINHNHPMNHPNQFYNIAAQNIPMVNAKNQPVIPQHISPVQSQMMVPVAMPMGGHNSSYDEVYQPHHYDVPQNPDWHENADQNWERSSENENNEDFQSRVDSINPSFPMPRQSSTAIDKSLSQLKEMKVVIKNKLENIVGKVETERVEEHIANNSENLLCIIPRSTDGASLGLSSTYSIWTSGANFYHIARSCIGTSKEKTLEDQKAESVEETEGAKASQSESAPEVCEGLPKNMVRDRSLATSKPIQVSSNITINSTTTSTLDDNYPIMATPQNMMYQTFASNIISQPNSSVTSAGTVSSTASQQTYFDTIHHGIIDPPQVRMSMLDPSGSRPSDPMDNSQIPARLSKEDRHRQQLNAVTDGIDPFNSAKNIPEEQKLKEALSFVMHDIKQREQTQQQANFQAPDPSQEPHFQASDLQNESQFQASDSHQEGDSQTSKPSASDFNWREPF